MPEHCTLGKLLLLRGVNPPPSLEKAVAAGGVNPPSLERPIAAAFLTGTLLIRFKERFPYMVEGGLCLEVV